ncbi:MAG TPA: hypothetical protein VFV95_06025 [Vicinamibacterales bacterium]|nr:hypothetical protein [Vicinamibacterales bacterium]
MLIAQALGEYGAMATLVSTFQSGLNQAQGFVLGLGMKEYFLIMVAGVVIFKLLGFRRR